MPVFRLFFFFLSIKKTGDKLQLFMKIKPFSELKGKVHLLNYRARNDPFIIKNLGGISVAILLKMASTFVVEKQLS